VPVPVPRARSTVRNEGPAAVGRDSHDVRRRRLPAALWLLAVGVLVADQVTKAIALAGLTPGVNVPVLGEAFGLLLVFNSGAAFSFATGSTWVFTIVAVVVAVVIVRISRRLGSRGWAIALGALLGGNVGNLADRLFREPGFGRGHVVDFLNYNGWFVGNVADIAIVLGAAGMALLAFLGIGVDGSRHHAPQEQDAEGGGDHEDPATGAAEDPDSQPERTDDASTAGAEPDPAG